MPQLAVLQRASAFVTHGGMNSVSESLFFGVPLVVVPQMGEQAIVGRQVEALSAGLYLSNEEATAATFGRPFGGFCGAAVQGRRGAARRSFTGPAVHRRGGRHSFTRRAAHGPPCARRRLVQSSVPIWACPLDCGQCRACANVTSGSSSAFCRRPTPALAAAWWAVLILRGILPAAFAVATGAARCAPCSAASR